MSSPNESPQTPPPARLVPGSWTTLLFLAGGLLLIVGYITFNRIADSYDVPEGLLPYATPAGMTSQLRGTSPPIPDTQPLRTEQVQAFVALAVTAGKPLETLAGLIDSIAYGNEGGKPRPVTNAWRNTIVLRNLSLMPAMMRRDLVAGLNRNNLPWDAYLRLKERMVAALHLSQPEIAQAFGERLGRYFIASDTLFLLSTRSCIPLLRRAAEIPLSPDIIHADSMTVAPFRQHLTRQGIGVLLDLETRWP